MRDYSLPLLAILLGFAFYYFLAIPLILEYAFAGVLVVVGLGLGLIYALPRQRRLQTMTLVLAFLLTLEAAGTLVSQPAAIRFGGMALLLLAYPLLAWVAARVPVRQSLPAVALAALLASALSPTLYPALTDFSPRWVSPPLTGQTKIPFFSPVVADLDGDGKAEIAAVTSSPRTDAGTLLLSQFRFEYQVFRWNGSRFTPVDPGTLPAEARQRLAALVKNEHPAAPALGAAWSVGPDGMPAFTFRPAVEAFSAVAVAEPGNLPFAALGLTLRDVEASHQTWTALEHQYGNPADQPSLHALASNREALLIAREEDLNGDGKIERLVNTPDGGALIQLADQAVPVWQSPNMSFRFEDVGRVGAGGESLIIAQDKGFWGFDPSRYLGAYRMEGSKLQRRWKVFVGGIINPVLADVDGDGQNEIVTTLYGAQRVIVLKKHALPVTTGTWAAVLTVLLWALSGNLGRRRGVDLHPAASVGVAAVALLAVALLSRLPSPALTLASGVPPAPPDAGAQPDPDAARVLSEAVKRMEGIGRYSFQGETLTYVGKRRTQTTFAGMVAPGGQMRAFANIWGDSYGVYRNADQIYLGRKAWYRNTVSMPELPPSLGLSLAYLPELAGNARRLPGTYLVVRDRARVYVLYPDAAAVKKLIPAALAPSPAFWDSNQVPGQFLIKVWVGEDDGLIHQMQAILDVPLAEASGLRQKTLVTFFNFNSSAVQVKAPEGVSLDAAR